MDLMALKKINDYLFEIPKSYRHDMVVPARVYATAKMLEEIKEDESLEQLVNVATLPGIEKYAIAMPDIHEGYGFPIGGVAALDFETGVVSPGGVGFDINCGVRLLKSNVSYPSIKSYIEKLANQIMRDVPSGVGRGGNIKLQKLEMENVLKNGAKAMIQEGFGKDEDLEFLESNGRLVDANPDFVSIKAKSRGSDQLGTLGSGNHFLEVDEIEEIYDDAAAEIFGLKKGNIAVLIHTGSRGLGHQVCADYSRIMLSFAEKQGIKLCDRELAYAPIKSQEGKQYLAAMSAAANFAWANRQVLTHKVREAWKYVFKNTDADLNLKIVYDVAHNIAKIEEHSGKKMCVHRKGATRAFPPKHLDLPAIYQETGQPVIIPGTMGTASYVLAGLKTGMEETFGTVCHGAGRRMSRGEALRKITSAGLKKNLEAKGIIVRCVSSRGLAEEAPEAYKDVDEVVDVVVNAEIAKKVAKLRPLAVVKGG